MTKIAYLSQVGQLTRRITYHTERLLRLRREADAVSSIRLGMGGGHDSSADAPFARMLERIEEAGEELEKENDLLDRLRAQAEASILSLKEEKLRLVLLYRYLEEKTFLQIGDLLYMDKSSAIRNHRKALESLELPEDCIEIPQPAPDAPIAS